ncbi:MAG: hypothetical protein WBG37_00585 [Desulfobacterales bacterium]
MEKRETRTAKIEQVGQGLFDFALEREDIKWLLGRFPREPAVKSATLEYELQILKIVTVGWAIAYHLESHPWKMPLQEIYWQAMRDFSQTLSSTTELMIGQDIDYFEVLKGRLDSYVAALEQQPKAPEPVQVIGPAFAAECGATDDLEISMTGSKIFASALGQVKTYLAALDLC